MSATVEQIGVAGIERVPGVCGGYPVIVGTRIAVRHIVEHLQVNGGGMDALLTAYPHLRREQVEAALIYYARFAEIVDEDIRRNAQAWEKLTGTSYDEEAVVPG